MASAIDPTRPADGAPADKADLRANLLAAKNEIEALQNDTVPRGASFDMQDSVLSRPELKDYAETSPATAPTAGSLTFDLEQGNVFEVTLDQPVTSVALLNPPAAGRAGAVTLILRQDAVGGHTLAWPAAVLWAGGSAPEVSLAAGAIDIYTLITRDGGQTWFGLPAGKAFA